MSEERVITELKPNPNNPRQAIREDPTFDELLASIEANGIIQPLLINEANKILAGHRRYFAAQILGIERVPVHVLKGLEAPHLIPLIENLQRLDLGVIEAADYFLKCHRDHEMALSAIAAATGISLNTVSNYIKLAQGPSEVRERIERDEIPLNAAFELLRHDESFIKEVIQEPRLTKQIVRDRAQACGATARREIDRPRAALSSFVVPKACPTGRGAHLEYAISAIRELLAAAPDDAFRTRYQRWINVMEDDLADLASMGISTSFRGAVDNFQRQPKPQPTR